MKFHLVASLGLLAAVAKAAESRKPNLVFVSRVDPARIPAEMRGRLSLSSSWS